MPIILVGSQKGGCGKSTTAVNIAAELSKRGNDVLIVDADPMPTASNWINDRNENKNLSTIHCTQRYENIRATLLDFSKRYDYVIADAAGRDSRELRTGMTAADILLVPFKPSQPDLDTLDKLEQLIIETKADYNPNLTALGLLTMTPTNPRINETAEAQSYIKEFDCITLLSTTLGERKAFRDAMSTGEGVTEMGNEKASSEIKSLVNEVLNHVN